MKAWVLEKYEGPQSIDLKEAPSRDLRENEVRVNVIACGINNKDLFISKGMYYRNIMPPIILGSDISGTVIEINSGASNFSIGERVLISPIVGCGKCRACLIGEENKCSEYESILGGLAEEIIVPERNLIRIPEEVSDIEAAALPIAYMTAWNMLFDKGKVAGSDTVLVWGASSGVGSAALTLLDHKENVIAIAGGAEKTSKIRKMGFARVIDYKQENVNERVMEMTNNQGVDVIFDPVGKAAWDGNLNILKHNGRHINCARNTGSEVSVDLGKLFSRQISILGAKSGSKKDLQNILVNLVENKKKPVIDRVFNFEGAKEALAYMERGSHFGKVVVKIR